MELIRIYDCFCDRTRLRILNLLGRGPLCVCHLQDILGEPQAKVSKHLSYLRSRQLVEVEQQGNWRIYRLVANGSPALRANLACLQDCAPEDRVFRKDLEKLTQLQNNLNEVDPRCCPQPRSKSPRKAIT